jgi:hypothetical protein
MDVGKLINCGGHRGDEVVDQLGSGDWVERSV